MSRSQESDLVTVAHVRKSRGQQATLYLFNEHEPIFTLRPAAKLAVETSKLLARAHSKKLPVRVVLDSRRALIQRVEMPSDDEIESFFRKRTLLDKPDPILPIEIDSIDPTKFNVVDHYLKFPCFRLCERIIPDYMTVKAIFDFCAKQSCHLPGPKDISPCIPFQYVRDGCYARAHKMRWIITTKYNYCCEKVFSFADQNNDTLAVKADKWGGCCVTWWYHVAPLVRVRVSIAKLSIVLAMVIDPGMFDKPVLLSTWLSAQKNKGCDPNANVSSYSIQPGSAYTPGFTTDPAYTATDATLINYKNLTTCP